MNEKFFHRGDAPFEQKVWDALDSAVIGAARSRLSGRKLLETEGPYGLGLRTIPMQEHMVRENREAGSSVLASTPWPLAYLHVEFRMPVREIAAFEEMGLPMNMRSAMHAALEIARMEDDLLFNGDKELRVDGLLNVPGSQTVGVTGWENVGAAADTIIKAINALDSAGFHGPYTLALSPNLYNLLLRRYPQGEMTELQHIGVMVSQG
ncbi:MAG: family 1 encapsulin nanocompartment shell protein, partial [Candidatus Latescibacterota bacterium]